MRQSGSWMTIWDDRILEIIHEEGNGSPKELEDRDEIRISKSSVSRRLKKLADHDLLQPLANGVYVITEEGEAYLNGEYDAGKERYINRGIPLTRRMELTHLTVPGRRRRLRWIILVGLVGFAYVVVQRILEILPPGVL